MAILIEHLKKQYVAPDGGVVPVIDIDRFELGDGEQVALIGTSGSGKTTLLHMIAGILTPDSGRIVFTNGAAPPQRTADASPAVEYRTPQGKSINGVDVTQLPEAD